MNGGTHVNMDLNSVGSRITIALVVLGMMAEILSDNVVGSNQPEPMTIEACQDLCLVQGQYVARVEGFACECRP